jgi:hypothetical protein
MGRKRPLEKGEEDIFRELDNKIIKNKYSINS